VRVSPPESLAQALVRVCVAAIEAELVHDKRKVEVSIVQGALCGLTLAIPKDFADADVLQKVYEFARTFMVIPPGAWAEVVLVTWRPPRIGGAGR
jgi:hypothetical protein